MLSTHNRYKTRIVFPIVVLLIIGAFVRPGTGQPSVQAEGYSVAAADSCSEIPQAVFDSAADCKNLDRGQVCYAHSVVGAEFTDTGTTQDQFSKAGDVLPFSAFKSLLTGPANPDTGDYGVSVMKLQATNLQNTLPGQAVVFITFGDSSVSGLTAPADEATAAPTTDATADASAAAAPSCSAGLTGFTSLLNGPSSSATLQDAVPVGDTFTALERSDNSQFVYVQDVENGNVSGWVPAKNATLSCSVADLPEHDASAAMTVPGLHSFYFTTAVGAKAACQNVPSNGVLIHSPNGQKVELNLNGADLTIGSTVFGYVATFNGTKYLALMVLSGQVTLIVDGKEVTVKAPSAIWVKLGGTDGQTATEIVIPAIPLPRQLLEFVCATADAYGVPTQGVGSACVGLVANPLPPAQASAAASAAATQCVVESANGGPVLKCFTVQK